MERVKPANYTLVEGGKYGTMNFYTYAAPHRYKPGDLVVVTPENEWGQPHTWAGVLLEVVSVPTKYKCSYTLAIHCDTLTFPKDENGMFGIEGMRFNESEECLIPQA